MNTKLTISLDLDHLRAAVAEVASLAGRLAQEPQRLRDLLIEFLQDGANLCDLVQVADEAAAGADEFRLVAQPTQRFANLLAALRAPEIELAAVEQAIGHCVSSVENTPHQEGVRR